MLTPTNSNIHLDTLNCLYEALVELMQTKPFCEIKKVDIIRKAGVSSMSFYRYYKTKDDVFINRLLKSFDELEKYYKTHKNYDRLVFWTAFYKSFQKDPIIFHMFRAGMHDAIKEHLWAFYLRNREYISQKSSNCECDMVTLTAESAMIVGMLFYAMKNGLTCDSEQLARRTLTYIDAIYTASCEFKMLPEASLATSKSKSDSLDNCKSKKSKS